MANFSRSFVEALLCTASAVTVAFVPGCVDKEKCQQAISVTHDAVAKEQMEIARQWRDRAWKMCNDPASTEPLDKEIVDKEAEIAKRAADAAKQVATAAQQRMNTATAVWKGYDALPADERTVEHLDPYRDKAGRMSVGLPTEYAQQIDAYNAREYATRRQAAEAAAKKK